MVEFFFALMLCLVSTSQADNEIYKDIRLSGYSRSPYKGRVEVRKNGVWGTVCDDKWSLYDGDIVCKMLGFNKALAIRDGGYFGQGTGPIHFDDLQCRNVEYHLNDCPGNNGQSDCTHKEDAGVECEPPASRITVPSCLPTQFLCRQRRKCIPIRWTCDGENDCGDNTDEKDAQCMDPSMKMVVRLVGGSGPHEGRVELTHNNEWGTICDDRFSIEDAKVICRQLGYSDAIATKSDAFYGNGNDHIWIDELSCRGHEPSIDECHKSAWGSHDCTHAEDAGVICRRNVTKTRQQTPKSDKKVCGISSILNAHNRKMRDQIADKGSWPWQASLRYIRSDGKSSHKCGATLIADKWAVTAAHCVSKANRPRLWKVRLGEYNERTFDQTEQDVLVSKIIVHSQYNVYPHEHDIALIKLDRPANLTSKAINSACLPSSPTEEFDGGDICYGTGWGGEARGVNHQFILNQVNLPVISNQNCQRIYGHIVQGGMLCAGNTNGNRHACQVDGGGPLVCYSNGSWKLAGIFSWGRSCREAGFPGVFTNVSRYIGWLKLIMAHQ